MLQHLVGRGLPIRVFAGGAAHLFVLGRGAACVGRRGWRHTHTPRTVMLFGCTWFVCQVGYTSVLFCCRPRAQLQLPCPVESYAVSSECAAPDNRAAVAEQEVMAAPSFALECKESWCELILQGEQGQQQPRERGARLVVVSTNCRLLPPQAGCRRLAQSGSVSLVVC